MENVNANNPFVLSIDSGAMNIPVNDNGEIIGYIKFNPNDFDIIKRYDGVVETLNNISLSAEATPEELLKVSDQVKEQIDILLGYPVSEVIFSKCNPFTPVTNGDFFFENVLDGLVNLIERTMNQRLEKKRKKIQAATAKYHK